MAIIEGSASQDKAQRVTLSARCLKRISEVFSLQIFILCACTLIFSTMGTVKDGDVTGGRPVRVAVVFSGSLRTFQEAYPTFRTHVEIPNEKRGFEFEFFANFVYQPGDEREKRALEVVDETINGGKDFEESEKRLKRFTVLDNDLLLASAYDKVIADVHDVLFEEPP